MCIGVRECVVVVVAERMCNLSAGIVIVVVMVVIIVVVVV